MDIYAYRGNELTGKRVRARDGTFAGLVTAYDPDGHKSYPHQVNMGLHLC